MTFLRTALFFLTLFLEMTIGYSQALQDDPKVNAEQIKKALDVLEKKQEQDELDGFSSFEKDIQGAASSEEEAVKFYKTCYRKVHFAGMKSDGVEWTEWNSKRQGMFSDKNFSTWILFQVRYLQLWMKAYKKTDLSQLEDPLIALAFEIRTTVLSYEKEKSSDKKLEDYFKNSLNMSIGQTVFSKAYHLEMLLKETKGWDNNLSKSEDILEKVFMDSYRSDKKPQLFYIWEKRIEWMDLKMKSGSKSDQQKFEHENEVLDQQWKMAQDFKTFGLQNKAINLMFTIVSKAPDHPQFEAWTKELRGMLGSSTP